VIHRASGQIAADRDPYHRGTGKSAVRAPPNQGKLVANLVVGRPDVIEELDLHHRLQAARGHAGAATDDVGLSQRRIENTLAAEFRLQAGGQLKDAALAFDLLLSQVFLAAAVGYRFPED